MNKLDLTAVPHRDVEGGEKSNQDMPVKAEVTDEQHR
jgi:hypothetical protein